jgi:hypothetical protein
VADINSTVRTGKIMNLKNGRFLLFRLLAALSIWLALAFRLHAQTPSLGMGTIKHFSVPDFYEGSNQKKSLLSGALAKPQPSGQIWIQGLRILTFRKEGSTNFIVEAPECLFDNVNHTASSGGPLQVRAADGRFAIQGQDGFMWQQTNSSLVISNQVRAVIRKTLIQPHTRAPASTP